MVGITLKITKLKVTILASATWPGAQNKTVSGVFPISSQKSRTAMNRNSSSESKNFRQLISWKQELWNKLNETTFHDEGKRTSYG